jgi:NADPH:quinone reductase-like Zn-dependent oxidoreductase
VAAHSAAGFGNTINGAQAEYLLVPHAQANLAKIPDELADEQVVLLADITSMGISAVESADLQIGDSVAVFAQGPILCELHRDSTQCVVGKAISATPERYIRQFVILITEPSEPHRCD